MLMLPVAMIKDSFTEDDGSVAEPGPAYSQSWVRSIYKKIKKGIKQIIS